MNNEKASGKLVIIVKGVEHEIKFHDTPDTAIQALYEFMVLVSEKSSEIGPNGVYGHHNAWGSFDTGPWQQVSIDDDNDYDVIFDE